MHRLPLRVPTLMLMLVIGFFGAARTDSARAADSPALDRIDGFLESTLPAYSVVRTRTGIVVATCRADDSCLGMMDAARHELQRVWAGTEEFGAGVAEEQEKPTLAEVGAGARGELFGRLLEAVSKPEFAHNVGQWFTHTYRTAPSAAARAGLDKLVSVAGAGKTVLRVAPYVYEGVRGAWATLEDIQAGDYEEATKELTDTALDMGAIWACVKAAGGAGLLGAKVGGVAGTVVPGVGNAVGALSGGVVFAVAGGLACWGVADVVTEKVSDVVGGWAYDKGKSFIDPVFDRAKRDIDDCVGVTDGFVEKFCTVVPVIKAAACINPILCVAGRAAEKFLRDRTSGTDVADDADAPGAGSEATLALVAKSARGGGLPVGAGTFEDGSPDGSLPGRSIHGGRDRVRARELDMQIQVGGSVVTTAGGGGDAITRIGSTMQGAGDVGGRYVTGIRGSVYNEGGVLEINPVGRRCEVIRNGRCCVEIHRGRCVLDKYKLSKKKRKKRRCATGYKRFGSWCYEYSDRRHALDR